MAKQIIKRNNRFLLIIKLNQEEAEHLGFGIGEGKCICGHCGEDIEEIYYLPVLNDTFCKNCVKKRAPQLTIAAPIDLKIQSKRYNYYKEALGCFWEEKIEDIDD